MTSTPVLPGWTHAYSGKVRDIYHPDTVAGVEEADELLMVASNRVSAFDFVLSPAIPGKGEVLTAMTLWWCKRLGVPNHLVPGQTEAEPGMSALARERIPDSVAGRALLVRRLTMYPVECVVRGYLTGSGWAEYRTAGSVCGIRLPAGLAEGDRLPQPIFTPARKAPMGEHDENISFDQTANLVGRQTAEALRDSSLAIYRQAAGLAEPRGIIVADTKFEFGADPATGELTLADEVLTCDSSRYWDAGAWRYGSTPQARMASFDKQIVRDWLAAHWDRTGTPPELPAEIVARTLERYRELLARLTDEG